ncbi:MAG: putative Ig domain-containing protein, partial [Verrucomicrobiales bacterium]
DTDLGTAWRIPSYDDSAWQSGQAALGVESDPLPIALVTPLAFQPPATHYFRHQFNFTGSPANTTLDLSTLVDDGGIVYLNGTEIARLRLPAQVNHDTFANTFVEAIIEGPFAVPDGLLLSGANTIAVETHQNTPDSSDIVFALKLGSTQQLPGTPAYATAQQILDSLRVTEIMYNPSGAVDDQEEFIEFQNIGPAAIELGGIRISDGVDFVFPAMTLDPGAYVMVVASVSGFQSKYGNSAAIAGEYGGRLDNGGETIQIQLPPPFEANILCFSYDDDWYAGSDGDGRSLTMVQPDAPIGLWDKASGWIPSTTIGGTPGAIGAPVITSSLTASGIQGAPFQYGIIAANTPGSFGASGLPQGLSINTDSGVILGSSQLEGSFDVTITATNVTGTAQETLVINFAPQPAPQINSPLQVTTLISTPFSYQITATNQPNSFGAQNLPAWLGFDPGTGTLSGTPTAEASVEIAISATNLTSTDTETLRIGVVSDPLAAAVDSVGLTWTSGGNNPWFETTAVSHDGVDSAQAGPIGDRQNSLITTEVSGPDTLTFWWRLTQPGGFHGTTLSLSMDGTEQFRVSTGGFGNDPQVEWEQRSLNIPAGIHTIAWNLNTRAFGTTGGTAFLDEVTLLSQGGQPLITSPTSAQTVVGQPFSYQITASNDPTSFGAAPLPPGLSVDDNGLISGTPTAVGDTTVLLSATNDAGTRNMTLDLRVTVPLPQALDTPRRIWTSGGAAAWLSQVDTTHDQSDAGQSGAIGDNQESWVETEFTGPGTLEFWWNVSSENGADAFRFELDGNQQGAISGTPGWQRRSASIPAGNHTARWVFARNASGGNGTDTAWLDEVVFTPADGDGDGLADSWEIENFGNLSQSADGDFDGDGSSNLDEQAALTNPADASDHFRITGVEPISIDLTELSWTSVAGQRYQVQASTSMGSWGNIGSPIEAIGDATSLIVTPPSDSLSMLTLVGEDAPARAFVPTSDIGILWRGGDETAFANQGGDTGWLSGSSGVGYEAGDGDYADFFGIDVQDIMADQQASVYLRVPFQINGPGSASSLTLRMRYDDGFAAFLNGVPVASSNAPQNPTWNSAATGQHPDQDAVVFEDYDISAFTGSLQAGGNILAIHGMNDEAGSSDILVEPVLQADLSGSVDFGSGFWRIVVLGP